MKWTSEYQILEEVRKNVNKWRGRAIVTVFIILSTGYFVSPIPVPLLPSATDRLIFTLRWQVPSLLTLLAGILVITHKRYHSRALDPISGKDQEPLMVHHKYLQNTVEQFLLAAGSQLVLATYLEPHQMQLIPLLALMFVVGRFTYWIGYLQPELGHSDRMFGFVLTITPSAVACVYCTLRLVLDMF